MKTKTKIELAVLFILVVFGAYAIPNAQKIGDNVYFLTYQPTSLVEDLAEDSGFNEHGARLFYRYSPNFESETEIKNVCEFEDKVLGCISGNQIYLLKFTNSQEYNRTIVTAAHEMLHIAYSRLNDDELSRTNQLLEDQIRSLPANQRDAINRYVDEKVRLDEAHSIVGSEIENLTTELQSHYNKYFSDRGKTTSAYRSSPEH